MPQQFLYDSDVVSHDYLYSFNSDGTLKWKHQTGFIYQTGTGCPATSAPAMGSDGTVYFGTGDDYLYALNSDGTLSWKFQTGNVVGSSPAIGSDGTVYVGFKDGFLYAIQGSSGLASSPRPMFLRIQREYKGEYKIQRDNLHIFIDIG
jgi:outer membrane protein assembly factor BamB